MKKLYKSTVYQEKTLKNDCSLKIRVRQMLVCLTVDYAPECTIQPSWKTPTKYGYVPDHRFLALSLIGETATCYEPQSIQSPSVAAMYWCYSKRSTYHWRIEFANYQHQLEVLLS